MIYHMPNRNEELFGSIDYSEEMNLQIVRTNWVFLTLVLILKQLSLNHTIINKIEPSEGKTYFLGAPDEIKKKF